MFFAILLIKQKIFKNQSNSETSIKNSLFKPKNITTIKFNEDPVATAECDIYLGSIEYNYIEELSGHRLTCNSQSQYINIANQGNIYVTNTNPDYEELSLNTIFLLLSGTLTIHFQDVLIGAQDPFKVCGEGVLNIYFEGYNYFRATKSSIGISCSLSSSTSSTSESTSTTASLTIHFYSENNQVGNILAARGYFSPGIGSSGKCTALIFHSGTIQANGGRTCPGIGTNSTGIIDTIEFDGSRLFVDSFGGSFGAGIGTGMGYAEGKSYVGIISIKNGKINATGGDNSAGIGSGSGEVKNACRVGSIIISGGEVSAWALWGAGIGCGNGYKESSSRVDQIIISNSIINAYSYFYGGGIGGGHGFYLNSTSVGLISIKDSVVTSTSYNGAGIGGGAGIGINSGFVDIIIIENSEIHASSSLGAGIGGGLSDMRGDHDSGYVNEIRILSGKIYASSEYACGIGGSKSSTNNTGYCKQVLIQGGEIYAYGGVNFSAIGNAQEIIISSGITKFLAASLTQYVIGCSFKNTYPEPYNFNCLSLNIFGKDLEPNIIDLENVEFPSTVISENPFKCVNKHQQYRRTCGFNVEYFSLTFSSSLDLSRFINIQSYLLILFAHYFVVL